MARIGPKQVRERYGVEPKQVPDFIALRGGFASPLWQPDGNPQSRTLRPHRRRSAALSRDRDHEQKGAAAELGATKADFRQGCSSGAPMAASAIGGAAGGSSEERFCVSNVNSTSLTQQVRNTHLMGAPCSKFQYRKN